MSILITSALISCFHTTNNLLLLILLVQIIISNKLINCILNIYIALNMSYTNNMKHANITLLLLLLLFFTTHCIYSKKIAKVERRWPKSGNEINLFPFHIILSFFFLLHLSDSCTLWSLKVKPAPGLKVGAIFLLLIYFFICSHSIYN